MATSPTTPTSPLNKIERAHQMYRDGRHEEALDFYTEALSMAKTKPQKIALHSNRAACYLKLHDFEKAAEECTLVLELDQNHTGALMLRAQTLVTLKEYHQALFDVSRLMELNPSSDVYQNLQARLKTQLSLPPIFESEEESSILDSEGVEKEVKEREKEEFGQEQQQTVEIVNQKIKAPRSLPNPETPISCQTQEIESQQQPVAFVYQKFEAPRTFPITLTPVSCQTQNFESQKQPPPANAFAKQKFEAPISCQTQKNESQQQPDAFVYQKFEAPRTFPIPLTPISCQTQDFESQKQPPPAIAYAKQKAEVPKTLPIHHIPVYSQKQKHTNSPDLRSKGSKEIPKPKGHSKLDYSRWDRVEDDSSEEEEEEEDEESLPQYRFRVRTVGVRPVK